MVLLAFFVWWGGGGGGEGGACADLALAPGWPAKGAADGRWRDGPSSVEALPIPIPAPYTPSPASYATPPLVAVELIVNVPAGERTTCPSAAGGQHAPLGEGRRML